MSVLDPVLATLGAEIAERSARLGRRVDVAHLGILDRAGQLELGGPGRVSANGACQLIAAADGWIAVNLAREEDRELIPAWLEDDFGEAPWDQIARLSAQRFQHDLVHRAALLGLPVSAVGETKAPSPDATQRRFARGRSTPSRPPRVLDTSALWAGPMCGAVLAAMGAEVTRVESLGRPDPSRGSTPDFFHRLNGAKSELGLDLRSPAGRARLVDLAHKTDILITGARPAALGRLGLTPEALFAANPALVWVAITGYGWASERVAFGDDAAAAGGLLGWQADGSPHFLGDALADPVTGLAAAAGALAALEAGGGVMVEAALAGCAAGAATLLGLVRAA